MNHRKLFATLLIGVSLSAMPAVAAAEAPPAPAAAGAESAPISEIVVTAQKRSESAQHVPITITALGGATLAARGIQGIDALAGAVPGMTFGSYGGSARISIRGIGFDMINPGGEGRIAYHVDGVYVSRPGATFGSFYDVDRVEVLSGPQGTLYGRNATGGSINVITREPGDRLNGFLEAGYGNYNALTAEGAIGGPIASGIGARLAFIAEHRDGYGKNIVTGGDIDNARHVGVRGTVVAKLGDMGRYEVIADYDRQKDASGGNHYFGRSNPAITPAGFLFGGTVPADPRNIANDFDPQNNHTFWSVTGRGELHFGELTLLSVTGYRHGDYSLLTDLDQTSASVSRFTFFEQSHQFSQELQLNGNVGRAKLILGGYYFHEKIFGGSSIPLNAALVGLPAGMVQGYLAEGNFTTDAFAAFGQVDYALTDTVTATVGLRYSRERKQIDDLVQFDLFRPYPPTLPPNPLFVHAAERTDAAVTPKFSLQYQPSRNLMFYASVTEGFKSGGFNLGDANNGFAPETIWSYEAGMKGTFADGRVRLNASAFYYDYRNLQVSKVVVATVTIENAATSTLYGLEAQLTVAPAKGLKLELTPAWLHSKYKNFESANPDDPGNPAPVQLAGHPLVQAPDWAVNAAAEYSFDAAGGQVSLRGEGAWQSRVYFTPFTETAVSRAPNARFNAFVHYRRDNWDLSFYGRNLTNRTVIASALVNSIVVGVPVSGTLEPPRTFGVKLAYRF